jgi:hypothetical protein
MKAPWKLQTARMRCPHCQGTIWMVFKGRWSIHRMKGEGTIECPTPQSPSLCLPEDPVGPGRAEDDSDG